MMYNKEIEKEVNNKRINIHAHISPNIWSGGGDKVSLSCSFLRNMVAWHMEAWQLAYMEACS